MKLNRVISLSIILYNLLHIPTLYGQSVIKADLKQKLDQSLSTYVSGERLAGVSSLVVESGNVIYRSAFGYQDREKLIPIEDNTIFRIYSMTKPIVSTALMMLYEEGKFGLDEPIEKYLPEFANPRVYIGSNDAGPIFEAAKSAPTIRQLLSHTAGLSYGFNEDDYVDQEYRDADLFDRNLSLDTFSKKLASLPLAYQPGTKWVYSFSVEIQGRLIEVLSGVPLDRFLAERIFTPLGMEDTDFYAPATKWHRLAKVYRTQETNGIAPATDDEIPFSPFTKKPRLIAGGMGLVSTLDDYRKFCELILGRGRFGKRQLLQSSTIELMAEEQTGLAPLPESAGAEGFGLGFGIDEKFGSRQIFWAGAASTIFSIDLENQIAVIMLTQLVPAEVFTFRDDLLEAIYK
ncbi:serine hydrolase domain-containing protein [Pseudobacteriovorax antillogorgiicola]|uniref:CubicO group peptidase, beta-lactamase class C family n=1 Tax=Pseudobacteriovorax antillogorgiicola TaxID=1513793 RepID=A0A1Y6C5V3_9BACT|nr:serine hydrolase domain-containing protein [Pseudobacteriovorax antillogorgiicola]TCS49842.1 CubicO group peptidase (beta-lactamase class C family) [Pseudobacteriovorax antillogorgiicola]SMF43596.1 CubicO group peptidase, beta-lactamase class C family [Pseudobacteriovorax antillogorgiicola]